MLTIQRQVLSHAGVSLTYAVSQARSDRPWLALLIPFGLTTDVARSFFDFFGTHYNIVTLESRGILEDSDRVQSSEDLSVANHAGDLRAVLDGCGIDRSTLIGYCSGAGVALEAAHRYPDRFEKLVLVHGDYAMLQDRECTTSFALEIDSLLSLASRDEHHATLVFEKIRDQRLEGIEVRPPGLDYPYLDLIRFRRYAANYLAYKACNFESLANSITHKSLLLTGGRDAQANVASSRRIHQALGNSTLHVDPTADHYGLLREESATLVTIWNSLCE
jgi:pimeloyl-ACP methyl ester carboxylesterase